MVPRPTRGRGGCACWRDAVPAPCGRCRRRVAARLPSFVRCEARGLRPWRPRCRCCVLCNGRSLPRGRAAPLAYRWRGTIRHDRQLDDPFIFFIRLRRVRIVSLVPSMTETLLAWDIEPVACTRFCERSELRHVGGTKDPDIGAIVTLAPDLVILDAEENRREDHDELVDAGVPVHVLHIRSLADVDEQLGQLARDLGRQWVGLGPQPVISVWAKAFVPIWRRPWIALGAPT